MSGCGHRSDLKTEMRLNVTGYAARPAVVQDTGRRNPKGQDPPTRVVTSGM